MSKTTITLLTILIAAVPRSGCARKEAANMSSPSKQQAPPNKPHKPVPNNTGPEQSPKPQGSVENRVEVLAKPGKYEEATFAAGCFWGVEAAFRAVKGAVATEVGYTGGRLQNPTYKQVCTDRTGHAEAVRVTYDPNAVSYQDLLDVFWKIHDPTTMNRQGSDVGTQYRSAIFYHTPQQQALARASMQRLQEANKFKKTIVTQIVPAPEFYRAEEYHQRYLEKQGKTTCSATVH
jgi:peptide-methionine (S)-S-oxide reductase